MASPNNLRSWRSAAQRHALAGVEREIRSNDRHGQRKYLKDFIQAFRTYESVLDSEQLRTLVHEADILLIGDYHALPASQRFASALFEQCAHSGDRPVVLGVETIFARDQHIVDEWWRREIEEDELRQRIRFDLDWNYDWAPFYELLVTAREHAWAIYGLDCMPRNDLRKIAARDRHAAHKIGEIRQRHPNAVIMVLFGEAHLAPQHLPQLVREKLPEERLLTVLQNVDALYWQAAGERHEHVEAVRVAEDVACVFNATPLEKYESYRVQLGRWRQAEAEAPDLGPTIYNLIDSLVRFLGIDRYSPQNGRQPRFLVDLLPEVYCGSSEAAFRRQLLRRGTTEEAIAAMLGHVEDRGSVYVPQVNAFYVRELQMMYAGEEAARFLHHACRGLPLNANGHRESAPEFSDRFYSRALEHAVAYFGSRVLYPARAAVRREEAGELSRGLCRQLLEKAKRAPDAEFDRIAQRLGYMIGSESYDVYLDGGLVPATLKQVLLNRLDEPGAARKVCLRLAVRLRSRKKPPTAAKPGTLNSRLG
jgi:Haem-binding uptake, Tiki superfamily, ChaN